MGRSGYSDDLDWNNSANVYRGAVLSAIRGRRGQAFLKEMLAAFDAMPEKKLVKGVLEDEGAVCAMGAVGRARGVDMSKINPENPEQVALTFGIADAMAREVAFENDQEWFYTNETPEQCFARMRAWVVSQILPQS